MVRDRFLRVRTLGALLVLSAFAAVSSGAQDAVFTPLQEYSASPLTQIASSPDRGHIAVATGNSEVRILNASTRKPEFLLGQTSASFVSVAFSPDGTKVAAGGHSVNYSFKGREIAIWDRATGALVRNVAFGENWWADQVAFSPDGSLLAAGGKPGASSNPEGRLVVWETATWAKKYEASYPYPGEVLGVSFSPDGARLCAATASAVRLLEAESGTEIWNAPLNGIQCAIFSPDGARIAVGRGEANITMLDAASGAQMYDRYYSFSSLPPKSLSFTPDGKTLAVSASGLGAVLMDAASGREIRLLPIEYDSPLADLPVPSVLLLGGGSNLVAGAAATFEDGAGSVTRVVNTLAAFDVYGALPAPWVVGSADQVLDAAANPSGAQVATACKDGTASIWDAATGALLWTLQGHTGPVNAVAFSPDGAFLATASADKTLKLWDTATGALVRTLVGHGGGVCSVTFSPDGSKVLSGSGDKKAFLWNVATGTKILSVTTTHGLVGVAFAPDGASFATAYEYIQTWNAATGALLHTYTPPAWCDIPVAYSPSGAQIALSYSDGTNSHIEIVDTSTWQVARTLIGTGWGNTTRIAFTSDGAGLLAGYYGAGGHSRAAMWEAGTGGVTSEIHFTLPVTGAAILPGGDRIVLSQTFGAAVWNVSQPDPALWRSEQEGTIQNNQAASVAISSDSARVLTSEGKTARLWDAASGELLRAFSGHTDKAVSVALSPDGCRILTGSWDKTARVWDTADGATVAILSGHTDRVLHVAFSPDGSKALTCSSDSVAKVWEASTGALLQTLGGQNRPVTTGAFSPDGTTVATLDADTVMLFDVATGVPRWSAPADGSGNADLAFSPNGELLYASDYHAGYCVGSFDVETGTQSGCYQPERGTITALSCAPDGKHLLVGRSWPDTALQLWDIAQGSLIRTYSGHTSPPHSVSFSPDGALLLSGAGDSTQDVSLLWGSGMEPTGRTAAPIALGETAARSAAHLVYADFLLDLEAGEADNLLVTLKPTGGAGSFDLLGRRGDFPTFALHDWQGAPRADGNAEMVVPDPSPGPYYISVVYEDWAGSGQGSFDLLCASVHRHISGVSPGSGGNAGTTTVRVSGLGFTDGTRVELRRGGNTLRSFTPSQWQEDCLTAPLGLAGLSAGKADVAAVWPDGGALVLAQAFDILAGGSARLDANLIIPAVGRSGRTTTLYLEYENAGTQDMPSPYFVIVSLKNLLQRPDPTSAWRRAPISLLGLDLLSEGAVGTLRPGQRYRIPFQVIPEGGPHEKLEWRLFTLPSDSAAAVQWAEQEANLRPPNVPDEAWGRIWPAFQAQAGGTWGQFQAALRLAAETISETGRAVPDPRKLDMALMRALTGETIRDPLAGGLDAMAGGPGVSLSFGRCYGADIPSRFRSGPLGYGWTHTLDARLQELPGGDVLVTLGDVRRLYVSAGGGAYRAMAGDFSALRRVGGEFLVSGPDGVTRTFGASGRIEKARDGRGNGVDFTYDEGGRLTQVAHTNGWALALSYDGEGRIAGVTDPFGQSVAYTYTGEFLTKVTGPGGRYVAYEYETTPGAAAQNALTRIAGADGLGVTYTYDSQGRLASVHSDGSGTATFTPDGEGRIVVTCPDGQTWVYTPDELGRFGLSTDPEGRQERATFDEYTNLLTAVDAKGRTTQAAWGPAGNPLSGVDASGEVAEMGWSYPADGTARQISVTDPLGHSTAFLLDDHGDVAGLAYADGSSEAMERNGSGRITSAANRRGHAIQYGYDGFGRLISKTIPGGASMHYSYDAAGRMERQGDASGDFVAQFDPGGSVTRMTGPDGKAIDYAYDAGGHRTSTTYPDGYRIVYEPDATGRLWRIKDGAGTVLMSYEYDSIGRLAREQRGNGTATEYAYDARGNVATVTHFAPGGTPVEVYAYTYDEVGNVLSAGSPSGTSTYAYDDLDRMTRADLPGGRSIQVEYDAASNRVTMTDGGATTAYSHDSQNRTTQAGAEAFTYDADGDLLTRTGPGGMASYTWDAEGQLLGAAHPSLGTATYTYDVMGRRQCETLAGDATRLVYDGTLPIAEYDGAGALVARYVYGFGLSARVAADGTVSYFGFDAVGNTRLVTGPTGSVANRYDYTPWGVPTVVDETLPNPFRFLGRSGARTSPMGHLLTRARAYDPVLGRFLSADPLVFKGGLNLYQYAGDNPLRWSDPSGLIKADSAGEYLYGKVLSLLNATLGGVWSEFGHASSIMGNYIAGKGVAGAGRGYAADPNGKTGADVAIATGDLYWNNVSWLVPMAFQLGGLPLVAELANPYFAAGTIFLTAAETIFDAKTDLFEDSQEAINTRGDRVCPNVWFMLHEIYGENIPQGALEAYNLVPQPMDNVTPGDPNEKMATPGMGDQHVVPPDQTLSYTIFFENIPTASAPAQEVFVTDALDPNLDRSTVRLTGMGWGDRSVTVTEAEPLYSSRQVIPDWRSENSRSWWLDLSAELAAEGVLKWTFRTLDPATGDLPEDPLAGFLPANDSTGRGEGWVSFTAAPKGGLPNGTVIRNKATIVFDVNAPIETNEVLDTLGACSVTCTASATPAWGTPPLSVSFTASATTEWCFGDATYSWTFGDGGVSAEQNPSHTYAIEGSYPWALAVTVAGVSCFQSGTVRAASCPCDADVNCDGVVNVLDLIRVQRCILGLDSGGTCARADVTRDGAVNILDLIRVQRVILGLDPCP